MKFEPVEYEFPTNLRWTEKKKGVFEVEGKPPLEVACPPEFGGHEGFWSPEDLFVASLELCIMTTFLDLIGKMRKEIVYYKSNAKGIARMDGKHFRFTNLYVKASIGVKNETDLERARRAMSLSKDTCLVTGSTTAEVDVDWDIEIVENKDDR